MSDVQPTAPETPTVPEPKVEPEKPHPLAPGGERFAEVYRDMQDARRAQARLEGELAAIKEQQQRTLTQTQQPRTYTPQQLQEYVDAGKITPAVMADQLAWQRAQEAREQGRLEAVREQRNSRALDEVNEYIAKIPALENTTSPEFTRVKRIAGEIAEELGLDIRDFRVQRRALREVYGSLDRVKAANQAADYDRQHGTRFSDTGGGGGAVDHADNADPLKDVPRMYKEHWARLGYTKEQMVSEAQYLNKSPRKGAGIR